MTSHLQRFLREIKEARKRRKDKAAVDLTGNGFIFTRRRQPVCVEWDAVTTLAAGTHAMISGEVFFVQVTTAETVIEIDEFADGFAGFEQALGDRFPGAREGLYALQASTSTHDRLDVLWTASG